MNAQQTAALEALAGRKFSDAEKATLAPLVAIRDDVSIASILSQGRTRYSPTQIGIGTVLVAMGGDRGGEFLEAVNAKGALDKQVYWGFDPVRRGVMDLSIPACRAMLVDLKGKLSGYSADIDKLLQVGLTPDPINFSAVSDALNKA